MFWSGNYIAARELKFLLKEVNVSLTQVLEADDILQECKADNNALIQFLTKPHILAELITLITEEPPKNVDLTNQYRHSNVACEVLTSHLSTLSDKLSMDTVQMNRLCDFINREPPLNPLLASFFSKTVEMLLVRNPKQDWYLYHIVCLRVLDFFKSRRDFLPNLLRHISTSAIADVFKYFIRLEDLFNKIVMEWLEEHQFLESLIQIICGTYVPEELPQAAPLTHQQQQQLQQQQEQQRRQPADNAHEQRNQNVNNRLVENQNELDANGNNTNPQFDGDVDNAGAAEQWAEADNHDRDSPAEVNFEEDNEEMQKRKAARMAAVASANAAALLCDLILTGCAPEGCPPEGCIARSRGSWALVQRLRSAEGVGALLQAVFTSPPCARNYALIHGCTLLRTLITDNTHTSEGEEEESSVELAIGPHLPLLHNALLHHPDHYLQEEGGGEGAHGGVQGSEGRVGCARVQVAALLAQLALCPIEEVSSTMLTLGTPGVLMDMFFAFPNNNFLHSEVHLLIKHAFLNSAFRTQYARHLIVECDLLARLMDVFEQNEDLKDGGVRSAYMGHVVLMLSKLSSALGLPNSELSHQLALQPALVDRWEKFLERKLRPLLDQHATPLGGCYPPANLYEVDDTASIEMTTLDSFCELNSDLQMWSADGVPKSADFSGVGLGFDNDDKQMKAAENSFLQLASQRFDDNMWDDGPEAESDDLGSTSQPTNVLGEVSPWECAFPDDGEGAGSGEEGWAQFSADAFTQPTLDPFAPAGQATPATPATSKTSLTDLPTQAEEASGAFGADEDFATPAESQFPQFWQYGNDQTADTEDHMTGLEEDMQRFSLSASRALAALKGPDARSEQLANNLLTAMSGMSPDAIANIVNASVHLHCQEETPAAPLQRRTPNSINTDDDSLEASPKDTNEPHPTAPKSPHTESKGLNALYSTIDNLTPADAKLPPYSLPDESDVGVSPTLPDEISKATTCGTGTERPADSPKVPSLQGDASTSPVVPSVEVNATEVGETGEVSER